MLVPIAPLAGNVAARSVSLSALHSARDQSIVLDWGWIQAHNREAERAPATNRVGPLCRSPGQRARLPTQQQVISTLQQH